MIDPKNPSDMNRLYLAIDWSRWKLQPFREKRLEALREFVGWDYSETGAVDKVPLNELQQAILIYLRKLISRAPRALVTSKTSALKPIAGNMQAWMDRASDGMELGVTLRMWVMDALFSLGVVKVGEAPVGSLEIQGTTQYVGQPFAEVVDLDDWAMDITAKHWDQCRWMANRYRVPLSDAQENPLFDAKARKNLVTMTRHAFNERGDQRTSTLSQGTTQPIQDEVEDYCELWDVWLAREKLVITIPYVESVSGGYSGPPLRVVEWKGPPQGPFHRLSFVDVPDNVMPAPPATNLKCLHDAINLVYRKLIRQSDRQKTVLGVMGQATEDGERIVEANDGEVIRVDMPDRAREYRFGGADKEQMLFGQMLLDRFNRTAGNLDSLGGLGQQTNTFHGDELLSEQSSAQVSEMQDRVMTGTQGVMKALFWHWWHNPLLTYSATRQVEGVDVPVQIPPQMRQVPFDHLDLQIDPYSMQAVTPQAKGGKLQTILQSMLIPLAPVLQQQGITVKWPVVFQLMAQYQDLPELADILAVGPPPEQQGAMDEAQGAHERTMAPVTTRNNVRTNRPAMTEPGKSAVMQQLLAGGGQGKQAAMIGRPNG